MSRQLGEDKDIEARKNNIILYRVPEHAFGTPAENSNRDISFFKFCQEGIEIEMTDQDVAKTYSRVSHQICKVQIFSVSPAKKFLCINIITQEKFHIFPTIFRGPPSMCNFKIMVSVLLR